MDTGLKHRRKITKLLKENIGGKLDNGLDHYLLDITPKAQSTNTKTNCTTSKFKTASKDTRMKMQPTEQKKILAMYKDLKLNI